MSKKSKIFISLGVVAFTGLLAVIFLPGMVAKKGANALGPKILGVAMKVDDVNVNLFSGSAGVDGVLIANPEGYKHQNAFELAHARFSLKSSSVLGDVIVIEEVVIDGAQISYEGLRGNNLKQIQSNVEKFAGLNQEKTEESSSSDDQQGPGKSFYIKKFILRNTVVKAVVPGVGGTIKIPEIILEELGSEEKGASVSDVIDKMLGGIIESISNFLGSMGKAISDGAKKAGSSIGEAGKKTIEGIKGLFD